MQARLFVLQPGNPTLDTSDGIALHLLEWNAVVDLVKPQWEQRSAEDDLISGKNSGLNSAKAAWQIVFRGHWYAIPRREGDCD